MVVLTQWITASKPFGIEVVNRNVVLSGEELVDDMRTQETGTAQN